MVINLIDQIHRYFYYGFIQHMILKVPKYVEIFFIDDTELHNN